MSKSVSEVTVKGVLDDTKDLEDSAPSSSSDGGEKVRKVMSIDDAFDEIDYGPFHWQLIALIGLTHACDAIEIGLIAFLQECIKDEWGLSGNAEALLSAAGKPTHYYSPL